VLRGIWLQLYEEEAEKIQGKGAIKNKENSKSECSRRNLDLLILG